jgi:hypothetical protein
METRLVSPTTSKNYTLEEILRKAFVRSAIKADSLKIVAVHKCFYGSKDFYIDVENLHVSGSLWCDSVSFRIDGIIPMHTTKDGKLQYGFRCGCWGEYGGQFPDNSEFSPEYKKHEIGKIICYMDNTDDAEIIPLQSIDMDRRENEYLCRIIRDIVQAYIARDVMKKA